MEKYRLIKEFRERHTKEQLSKECPFTKKTPLGNRVMCSYCSELFGMWPPVQDAVYNNHIRQYCSQNRYCPCNFYGINHVSKTVDKFMRGGAG